MRNFILVLFVLISTNIQSQVYCTASGGSSEYISLVDISNVYNVSSYNFDGYEDFTNISIDMVIGGDYPMVVLNGYAYSADDQCGVWCDWNNDHDFYDAGEFFLLEESYAGAYFADTISVPITAQIGQTRMRIRIRHIGTLGPCGMTPWGEVEDYTINVLDDCEANATFSYFDLGLDVDFFAAMNYDTSLYSVNWNFGDGVTNSSQSNPTHLYAAPGTYTVSFSVMELADSSCFDSYSVGLTFSDCEANATFSYDVFELEAGFNSYYSYDTTLYDIVWDMGDGSYFSNADSIYYLYDTAGVYTVNLVVSDLSDSTCTDTMSLQVDTWDCNLSVDFSYEIMGSAASFYSTFETDSAYSIDWSLGDSTSIINGPDTIGHLYYSLGFYTVTLTVTHIQNPLCSYEVSHIISINNCYADADFTYLDNGLNYVFEADYLSAGYYFIWDFGDGNMDSISGITANHDYLLEDYYDVTLIVGLPNDPWCTDTMVQTIYADSCAANAFFTGTFYELTIQLSSSFVLDTAIYLVQWDFGDSTTLVGELYPIHVYANAGIYPVILSVQNIYDPSCFDSYTIDVQVFDCSFVEADFDVYSNGNFNYDYVIANSYPTTGYQIYWDMGDGTFFYGEDSVNYTYSNASQYNVVATVTCFEYPYCEDYFVESICAIDPSFSFITTDLTAEFFIDNSYNPWIFNLEWNFGDGTIVQNDSVPVHTYAQEDTYQVSLYIQHLSFPACTDELTQDVFVADCSLNADFTYSINSLTVDFSTLFSSSNFFIEWNFGDGNDTSDVQNISHTYLDPGTYNVCVMISDLSNPSCSDTICYDLSLMNSIDITNSVLNSANIFPNPVNDILNLRFTDKVSSEYNLVICDITGKELISSKTVSKADDNLIKIDVHSLPDAIYYLRFSNNDTVIRNFRFVKITDAKL